MKFILVALCLPLAILAANCTMTITCQHGGIPNDDCSSCIDCLGAWSGVDCGTWDDSVEFDILAGKLTLIAKSSEVTSTAAFAKKQTALPSLPTSVGLGVDSSSGQLKLPILAINPVGDSVWTNSLKQDFQVPKDVKVVDNLQDQENSTLYVGMYDYIIHQYSMVKDKSSTDNPGPLDQPDLVLFYQKYFNGDSYITVAKDMITIYDATLTQPLTSYTLESHALAALQSLPPTYDSLSNKALFQMFIKYWGTHVAVTTSNGGILLQQNFLQSRLLEENNGPYTKAGLEKMSAEEFQATAWGDGTVTFLDQTYLDNRTAGQLSCQGGNAAELCSPGKYTQWKDSIPSYPSAISYQIESFSTLLPEPMKTNIQSAIDDYLEETYQKWVSNIKTCPDCLWGSCTEGEATECTCYNSHITGRTCDQCISGWHNELCVDAICTTPCNPNGGACTAPDTCTCWKPYYGTYCQPVCGDNILQYPEQCDTISFGADFPCCVNCMINFGSVCRMAKGDCDNQETCDMWGQCPFDTKKQGTPCGYAYGDCAQQAYCDGWNDNCPNSYRPYGTVCRPAMGPCDKAETCDGFSSSCPFDQYQPYGTFCGYTYDNKPAYCNGYSASCPSF